MAIADPKSYAVKTAVDTDENDEMKAQIAALQEQLAALITSRSSNGLTDEGLEKILLKVASATAEAQERIANPSNKTHPGISVYSYPEGDRLRPRELKCPMTWAGHDLGIDTTSAEEIDLLNVAEPGVYSFMRTDKSPETLTVKGERDAGGTLTKMNFEFLVSDKRETLPDNVTMLRSAFRVKSPEQIELEALRAEIAGMRQVAAQ